MEKPAHDLFELAFLSTLRERLGASASITLTDNRRTLISMRRRAFSSEIRLSRRFSLADSETLDALVSYLSGKTRVLPASVKKFMNRVPVQDHVRKKALKKLKSAGAVHDLNAIAGKVNSEYFGGALSFRISWGRVPTKIKRRGGSITLGSYDNDLDLVRIHPALDNHSVPSQFIEFIVYHELLHKKLGTRMGENGERTIHCSAFRQMERGFSDYEAAKKWEKENIHSILRARKRLKNAARNPQALT